MINEQKVLIIGAGRMGIRHAQGIVEIEEIRSLIISDINELILVAASQTLNNSKCSFFLIDSLISSEINDIGICIIASTAGDRISLVRLAQQLGAKNILIEKPLGQSMEQVIELNNYIVEQKLNCFVNLNMRLYESFINLKHDFNHLQQLRGEKAITLNTGTLGIGANGIHYLDLLFFLLDADSATIVAGEIDERIIPSGRGPQFGDFGGWAMIKFFGKGELLANVFLSMSASSTVFGAWDIVGPHGRVYLSEVEEKRIDTLRKDDSELPLNRYFGDYLPPVEAKIESPFLGDLTRKWVKGIIDGEKLLPAIDESIRVHELLFEWLGKSNTHKTIFPIT
jgi:predicted dehydrogenase